MFWQFSRRLSILVLCGLPAAALAGELTVVGVEPAPHALDAGTDATIRVEFDRPLVTSSVTPSSFSAFGRWSGAVTGSFSFSNGDRTATLTPARPFSAGESVMVVLSHDLQGAAGSSLRAAGYSFQFWVRAAPTTLDFALLDVLATGTPSRPYGGIGSDVDGDGYLDLTIVNEDTSDLRVFLNSADGSGLFDDYLLPTTGTGFVPSPSEPADFDGDGDVDVAVANTVGSSVSVLLGNGDGTFAPHQEIPVGGVSRGIAVLDFDGDGDVDVAATDRDGGRVVLLVNDGAGVMSDAGGFGTGSAGEWSIAAGDMDDDGVLDLVVGGRGSGRIYVYLGNGDGTFTLAGDRSSGGSPWMLVLGDVDGDGDEDVAVASSTGVGSILLGDGAGGLGAPQVYGVDPFALATDLADLDGDGDLDWVVASFGGDWTLFANDGGGGFTFEREFAAPEAASCSLAMDVDNDGDLDLALVDELANVVILMRNPGIVFADGFESGDTSSWSAAVP